MLLLKSFTKLYGRRFILCTDHEPFMCHFSSTKAIPVHAAHRSQIADSFGHVGALTRLIAQNAQSQPDDDVVIRTINVDNEITLVFHGSICHLPVTFNSTGNAIQCNLTL